MMSTPRSSADDYAKANLGEAWEILQRGCEIPPSLEVFRHELTERRRTSAGMTAAGCARRMADVYHRTKFSHD